jgi:hypothetical protein
VQVGIAVGIYVGIDVGVPPGSDAYTPAVAATLRTSALTPTVATASGDWTAILTWAALGVVGNGKELDVRFDAGAQSVEVRDNERCLNGTWTPESGVVGVLVRADVGLPVTVGEIETAINAMSALCSVTTPDPSPSNEIDISFLDATNCFATFSGGV